MKLLTIFKKMWLVPFLCVALIACEAERVAVDNSDTLAEFETWVDNATSNIEQETEESWSEIKNEFDKSVTELDAQMEEWDEEAKIRYKNARNEFATAEIELRQRWDTEDAITVEPDAQFTTTLIGTSDYNTIKRENIEQAYQSFLQNVRTLDDQWTEADWDKADIVMDRLDERRKQIDVPTEASARIIAWKGEYNALKAADDIDGN